MAAPAAASTTSDHPGKPEDPADYFPPSYRVSRERFLEQLHRLSGRLAVRVDSRSIGRRGPEGETLALDFAIIGARRPRHVLVLSSGTHGVEGYAGSALQHWALAELLPRLTLADDSAVILQHANNPYGFAWHRRVNEDNIDLNRNFLGHFDPQQCSRDYELLYDCLNPADLEPANEAGRWARIREYIATQGLRQFQQVVTEGQYKFPAGLQFGGQAQAESTRQLIALVGEHLAQAQTVIWIDIHTGLGESGACELITGAPLDSPSYAFAQQLWGGAVRSATSGESISVSLGGVLDLGLQAALPAQARSAFVFPEYGTWPPEQVIEAMRADNWLHHHGQLDDANGRAIKARILEAFRPASPDWARTILAHGSELVTRTIAQLPGARLGDRS